MGLHTATGSNRWVNSGEAKIHPVGRLNIGPRLILGFGLIILSMLAADAVVLWQFHVVHTQAARLNDIDQKLVAVLRVHTALLTFYERLDALADAEDTDRLVREAGPLRTAVLEDIRRATSVLSRLPVDLQRDPTILPTLHAIQSALSSQLEGMTTLATSGDWRAVRLRLTNQVRPLESLASALVEKVVREAGEEQAQIAQGIRRVQRLVFLVVPLTAAFTLLIAATLGLAITRSITRPLARLVEGSKALARGEFHHQVSVTGKDELAHLGHVFNDTARQLRDLYATLQSNEDRLRRVIDTIPAHAWSTLPDGSVDFVNKRFLEFTGRSREDLLGWGWGSVVHHDDLTSYVEHWRAAVAAGEPMESEARVLRADGDYRWLLIRNVPLRDELGKIVNWYGTAIDIEERQRAEEALRRSEADLHDAQRVSHTGSWRHDFVSGLVTTSPEALRIWGANDDEDASATDFFFGRMHPEDRPAVEHEYQAALRRKADFGADFRIVLPDGTVKNIHTIGRPTLNQSGDIMEFVGTVMDVTERKRAEEALREAQAELAHVARVTTMGEMAASIAHEIKQPIAAAITDAKTCLRWLERSEPDVPEACDAAERLIKDVTRAADIISSISELFKKGSVQREWVDVNALIREMMVLLRSESTRHSISIVTELDPNLPRVMADRLQLQQVFMNLMLNGIDAMKHGSDRGELTIRSQADDGSVVISVSDTGPGLAPEQADQIFRAFFTTKDHGIGMGLPISRSIIESHGGRLWASSNSPQGATFQFSLPATIATHA